MTKTLERPKHRFYWVVCHQAVTDWTANCTQCIAAKGPVRRGRGQLQQYNSCALLNRIIMVSDKMKGRYERATNTVGFHEGQLLLFYNPTRKKGSSPNLQSS